MSEFLDQVFGDQNLCCTSGGRPQLGVYHFLTCLAQSGNLLLLVRGGDDVHHAAALVSVEGCLQSLATRLCALCALGSTRALARLCPGCNHAGQVGGIEELDIGGNMCSKVRVVGLPLAAKVVTHIIKPVMMKRPGGKIFLTILVLVKPCFLSCLELAQPTLAG